MWRIIQEKDPSETDRAPAWCWAWAVPENMAAIPPTAAVMSFISSLSSPAGLSSRWWGQGELRAQQPRMLRYWTERKSCASKPGVCHLREMVLNSSNASHQSSEYFTFCLAVRSFSTFHFLLWVFINQYLNLWNIFALDDDLSDFSLHSSAVFSLIGQKLLTRFL